MSPTWPATNKGKSRRRTGWLTAFTLVELLISIAILSSLVVVLAGMVNQTSSTWAYTRSRIEEFREARDGFDTLTRRLSQATLNTYLDYADSAGAVRTAANASSFIPSRYVRASELRFISGQAVTGAVPLMGSLAGPSLQPATHAVFFQAPLGFVSDRTDYSGLGNLLNTWGYYIDFNSDASIKPPFVSTTPRYRFRLMELMQPSESMSLYKYTAANPGLKSTDSQGMNWFTDALLQQPRPAHVLAENIIAMIILPKLSAADEAAGNYVAGSLAPNYNYDSTLAGAGAADANLDSRNQLPPVLAVTMVVVDESSFNRFQGSSTTLPETLGLAALFQTVGDTEDPSKPGFAHDLQTLQKTLQAHHINYRVFTSSVAIKGAKWSRAQTN